MKKRRLEVILSPYTGYCFGVKRAMRLIDDGLRDEDGCIYTLGEVIHNKQAVDRLKARGVRPVSSIDGLETGATLVVRAHGVHPSLKATAEEKGIKILDATCPFVQKSQHHVKKLSEESYHVIIIGDRDHPEVRGISGYAGDKAIIVGTVEEAREIGPLDKAGVVIQTTLERDKAMEIIDILKRSVDDLRVYDTICQATILRREATLDLAERVDLMLVVGGKESSNTKRLYAMCRERGIPTKFIETADEIEPSWFEGCERVGIATGTSTPGWVTDDVLRRMREISEACEG